VPAKDSADRVGVIGALVADDSPQRSWLTFGSLVGELTMSKAKYGDAIALTRRATALSLPAEVRWALLPPLVFTSPVVDIAGIVQPPYRIAGDVFEYAVTENKACVAVLDAIGHGLVSARMANVAVGTYRNARRGGASPSGCIAAMDSVIASAFGDARFITGQLGELDLDGGRLVIANAGHPPPLVLRHGGTAESVSCPPGRPIGLGVGEPAPVEVMLHPGDAVLFQTDGIIEARSPAGEPFGEARLANVVLALFEQRLPPAEVLRLVGEAVVDHLAGRAGDDRTLVMLRWHGPRS
jgi:serine phosphatase RsbU (regulator of sigma subunit)